MKEKLTKEVIARAIDGDRTAYDIIYRRCEGSIRNFITSHLNDKSQIDDVLQNTFISVYNNITKLKSADGFKKWIFTIAYNECMTVNKVVSREQQRSFSLNADYDTGDGDGDSAREFADDSIELPEEFVTNMELQKLLIDTLNSLPQKQRDCVVLYYYQKLPLAEIGERLGMNENTVKTHKSKALANLRRKLEKYRGDYNFAMVPMSALFKGLTDVGKVKSKFVGLSGAAVGHSVSAGAIAGATVTAAVVAIGVFSIAASVKKAQFTGDYQPNDPNAVSQVRQVETPQTSSTDAAEEPSAGESAPDAPDDTSAADNAPGVPDDTSAADNAPGVPEQPVGVPDTSSADNSSYTAYNENESGQPQYVADSSLEAYMSGGNNSGGGAKTVTFTDSQTENGKTESKPGKTESKPDKTESEPDKTESKPDKTESEPDKTESEPEQPEPMTFDKITTMTLGEYMNAADGQYEWVDIRFGQKVEFGIRNLAYPNYIFQTECQWDMPVGVTFTNTITVPKEVYVNSETALSIHEGLKDEESYQYYQYSTEDFKAELEKKYDSNIKIDEGFLTYSLDSNVNCLYCLKGADMGNGITVGMTFNEIKSIVGDDFEFEPVGGNALASIGPVAAGMIDGVSFEIAFELTDEETEIYSNALAAKIKEIAGTEAPLNVSIPGFNPKSRIAVVYYP